MNAIFDVTQTEQDTYLSVIRDFLVYVQFVGEEEADEKAKEYLANLLQGLDFDGNNVPVNQARYFDTLLSKQTGGHYKPTTAVKTKHPRLAKAKKMVKSKASKTDQVYLALVPVDEEQVERIMENLLTEYPFLTRDDLREDVQNYSRLKVVINNLTNNADVDKETSVTLKNLMDAQIRLGNYLGIDEGRRAKQKELLDRQSIAALSIEFQETIAEFPELLHRFKYEEIRILLERYDRNELERQLFESAAYANMSISDAREFVARHELKYEQGPTNK